MDKIVIIALKGLYNILNSAEQFQLNDESQQNKFIVELEKLNGINRLEDLQNHPNEKIYENTLKILEAFFDSEEDY